MAASLTAPNLPPVGVSTPAPAPNAGLAWLPSEVILAPPEYANPYSNLRILVRAPAGLPDNTVESLQEKLTTSGAAISDLKRVTFNVSQSHARFFSPENKEAAQRIAAAIGGQARDFTSFSPAPPQGTIEIYLAGRSNVRSTRTSRATTRRQTEAEILRNRVIRRLRLGEILQ